MFEMLVIVIYGVLLMVVIKCMSETKETKDNEETTVV